MKKLETIMFVAIGMIAFAIAGIPCMLYVAVTERKKS